MLFAPALMAVSLQGTVVDPAGNPLPGATVFAEPGLASPLLRTVADASGHFIFESAPQPPVGIVAYAPGHAYGGTHLTMLPPGGQPLLIALAPAAEFRGTVKDLAGKPVAGAQIARVALLDGAKVAIPLAKMQDAGIALPVTDAQGAFQIPGLPQGALVAVKVMHPHYAQEGAGGFRVGTPAEITLSPGVILEGTVLELGTNVPVGGIRVTLRSAHPPHDTTLVVSANTGQFLARLKPGLYAYRAEGDTLASSGWQNLTIAPDAPQARLAVYVGGVGTLAGEIKDAVSGAPVEGVRVVVQTERTIETYARSDASGRFQVRAAEGDYVIALEGAPGYFPPASGATKVRIAAGQHLDLPGMWLAPIPPYQVYIVDEAGQPVTDTVITLLRPYQLGWHAVDAQGHAELQVGQVPEDGKILGLAEHLHAPMGALFVLTRESGEEARVQLLPMGTTQGRVVNSRGRKLEGAVVGSLFPGENDAEIAPLWRTLSNGDGIFSWRYTVPGLPQRVLIRGAEGVFAESRAFSLDAGGAVELGDIRTEAERGTSLLGSAFPWKGLRPLCEAPAPAVGKPALVICCAVDEVAATLEACKTVLAAFGDRIAIRVVADGAVNCENPPVPLYSGKAPASCGTYVLDASGTVTLETFGLPPAFALHDALKVQE
jgi:hypothetical protein